MSTRIDAPRTIAAQATEEAPKLIAGPLLLSQSGAVMPGDKAFLPPGRFKELVITAQDEGGVHAQNRFNVDKDGKIEWASARPLGHVPYKLTLVAEDGSTYSALVDVTPKKLRVSHQGYEELKGLAFTKDPDPPKASFESGPLSLSQSGAAIAGKTPFAPAGQFSELIVSGSHAQNKFPIDDDGRLGLASSHGLGHVPYRLTLVAKDGARYHADVDVTPKKLRVSHQGYETLSKLTFVREAPLTSSLPPASDDGKEAARNFAARQPVAASLSPIFAYFDQRRK